MYSLSNVNVLSQQAELNTLFKHKGSCFADHLAQKVSPTCLILK